ncbi:hypothetical protein GCM10020331_076530 [Ectobacillus funiculus]
MQLQKCFEIEERLRESCNIPIFHDDQHGTAIVTAAGLINALKLAGKNGRYSRCGKWCWCGWRGHCEAIASYGSTGRYSL